MSMRSSLVSDCNLLIKKASTRKGEAFCVKGMIQAVLKW